MVFENIKNFTMTASNSCKIYCFSNASIIVVNVTNFELHNITLLNCGKNHTSFINSKQKFSSNHQYHYDYHSSILLYHCTSVRISNINMSTNAYIGGILAMNVKNDFEMDSVNLQLECFNNFKFNHRIHGILFRYNDRGGKNNAKAILCNFSYKVNGSCIHFSRYAIKVLLVQEKYTVSITINNSKFENLNYTGALYYYMSSCKYKKSNYILIKNSTIFGISGAPTFTMFYIKLFKLCSKSINFKNEETKQYSNLNFRDCAFIGNYNMQAVIYIMPASTSGNSVRIEIWNAKFIKNRDTHFIEVKGETEIVLWQISTYIYMHSINVSLNKHHDGSSLISITNGVVYLMENSTFMHNIYYDNLLMLRWSIVIFSEYIIIANNCMKHIIEATSGSYLIIGSNSVLNIINNTVHAITKQEETFKGTTQPLCPIQFLGNLTHNDPYYYDNHLNEIKIFICMLNNVHTVSKGLIGSDLFGNCTWLTNSAFRRIDAASVYHKVFRIKHIIVSRNTIRKIPLSVCPCAKSNSSCHYPILNSIYPGQTLHVNFMVRKEDVKQQDSYTTLVVANTPADDCSITESYQLSQTHFNHGCNNYSYTIWPSHKNITECKLFVRLMGMPEMLFVDIKPCPRGFILQPNIKQCDCDPALNNIYFSVTSCDLDQQTIFRPANSWISSDTFNNSYTYVISPHCPFYYCLRYSSSLLLTTPDMQCQFKRSGTLCGRCQEGLSTVFGSSQCRQCSSLYLFIIVPIAIVGVLMVIALFVFNITINSGSFNTYIFYVNMISINYSSFCPDSNSFECTLLSLFNLDLGIETCFYDGMDDYSKMWLQLTFPFYLIIIAIVLIISSRYSPKVQRLNYSSEILAGASHSVLIVLHQTLANSMSNSVYFFFDNVSPQSTSKNCMVCRCYRKNFWN